MVSLPPVGVSDCLALSGQRFFQARGMDVRGGSPPTRWARSLSHTRRAIPVRQRLPMSARNCRSVSMGKVVAPAETVRSGGPGIARNPEAKGSLRGKSSGGCGEGGFDGAELVGVSGDDRQRTDINIIQPHHGPDCPGRGSTTNRLGRRTARFRPWVEG